MNATRHTLLSIAIGLAFANLAHAQVAAPTTPVTSTAPAAADAVDRATQPAAVPPSPTAQSQAQRTEEERKTMPPQDPRWTRLDADADGRVSPIEADKDSKFGMTFDDMDTDDDGMVSAAEYGAFGKAAASPTPPPTAQGAASAEASVQASGSGVDSFAGLDLDKDGRVSSTEAGKDAGFDAGFAAMDANGDGFVTDAEHRAHAEAKSKP